MDLGALLLALHHDAGGLMGHAHSRGGFIYVLATGAASAIGVHTHLVPINFYIHIIIQLRHNVAGCKGSVAASVSVEGRDTH